MAKAPYMKGPMRKPTVGVLSLGCAKNLVDSEVMLGALARAGFPLAHPEDAEVVIVNTCGFLQAAAEEAEEEIRALLERKRRGALRLIAVGGCLVQRLNGNFRMPGVDLVFGLDDLEKVPALLQAALRGSSPRPSPASPTRLTEALPKARPIPSRYLYNHRTPRVRLTPAHYAYVKVAEGCDHTCTFCTIPSFRGAFRSRLVEDIVAEVENLVAEGVREVILVAQDLGLYGRDLYGRGALPRLLQVLDRIDGLQWIRLLYLYPALVTEELARAIGESEKVVPYIEMPIQHISHRILTAMNRGGRKAVERALEHIHRHIPDAWIRTEIIVGFPGETEEEFQELLRFLEEGHFHRIGVFPFSPEPGTPAAALPDQIPEAVKAERVEIALTVVDGILERAQRRLVGRSLPVLIDQVDGAEALGRTPYDAPEVDFSVHLKASGLRPGRMVLARILDLTETHDLVGQVWADSEKRESEP